MTNSKEIEMGPGFDLDWRPGPRDSGPRKMERTPASR